MGDKEFYTYDRRKLKKKLLKRNNNTCVFCGGRLSIDTDNYDDKVTLEHIIPLAIYKWTIFRLNGTVDEALDKFNNLNNMAVAHYKCNVDKGCTIISNQDIDKLFISNRQKHFIKDLKYQLREPINSYVKLCKRLIKRQNNRCYKCHKPITLNNSSIRRINLKKKRSRDNACLLCKNCNTFWRKNRKSNTP